MQLQLKKTLNEFDLRLTEVCAATHIESALEKQREIIRLLDDFTNNIHHVNVKGEEMIEINYHLKDLLNECITNRNHLGDFNSIYEDQNDEIIDQLQKLIRHISRLIKRSIKN